MKKSNDLFTVKSIAQLNIKDLYVLNTEIETYNYNGKVTIPVGSVVNFLSLTNDPSLIIIRSSAGLIEKIPFVFLSEYNDCFIGKIISLPKGIDLCTHDGVFSFESESKFKVEAIFYTNHGQYRPEEKTCFIRYVSDKGEETTVTGIVPFYAIKLLE